MINPQYFWQTIILLAIGTFSIRSFFIFLASKISISKRIQEIFTFIPAAILPALLSPMVYSHKGDITIFWGKERLVVIIFAIIICYKTRNILLTVLSGLILLFLMTKIHILLL